MSHPVRVRENPDKVPVDGLHTMALDQSALLSLLNALRSSANTDLVRVPAERLLQERVEAGSTGRCWRW
jgi:hypothetical protein